MELILSFIARLTLWLAQPIKEHTTFRAKETFTEQLSPTIAQHKSAKEFVRHQIGNGIIVVHLFHDISIRMDDLNFDRDPENVSDVVQEVNHMNEPNSDVTAFDALDDCNVRAYDRNNIFKDAHFLESVNSSSAKYHIASCMNSQQLFFR